MADLKQRLEQHAAAYSLLGEKDLPALLREAAASLRAAPEVEALSESDKEIALAQAVELAQYVEKNAKGGMREAAARFLSLSYAQDVAQRLRAAPADLAERHAATERDACRMARIAEEQRDGRLAALERVAELEAKLRAAPEGYVLVPVELTSDMNEAGEQELAMGNDFADAWEAAIETMLAARPQGVR